MSITEFYMMAINVIMLVALIVMAYILGIPGIKKGIDE